MFKKIGINKKIKFKTKKLKKYVTFGVNLKKTLFEVFLALKSYFSKEFLFIFQK